MNIRRPFLSAATALFALSFLPLTEPVSALGELEADADAKRASRRPITLSKPGAYVLDRDLLIGGGVAIEITGRDVTLDLAGHNLAGPGERGGVGIRIREATNVRVFNGHVRRFGIGVQVLASTNVSVQGLQIDGMDSGGAPPDVEIGILLVNSRGIRVADNTITDTFLGIFVRGEASAGNRIADNLITGGDAGELGICYNPAPGESSGGPHGDLVYGNVVSRFRRGLALSPDSTGNVVRNNTIAFFDLGIVEETAASNVIAGNDELQIAR